MPLSAKALGKRKADSDSDSDVSSTQSQEEALALLQAQGAAFLQSFGGSIPRSISQNAIKKRPKIQNDVSSEGEEEDEWGGLEDDAVIPPSKPLERPKRVPKPKPTARNPPATSSEVVVFSELRGPAGASISKRDAKALMSSKVNKIHSQAGTGNSHANDASEAQEQSLNLKDKELFRLLHTQLLAGRTDSAIHQTNGERRRALQGRVIELAGGAKVGHGLKVLHHDYKVHQPKRTRDIIEKKERVTDAARKAEFEENGIFHKDNKKSLFLQVRKRTARPRLNGIGEGIGKYKDGTLTLSKADIASITGPGKSSGGGRKKGGGGGRRK